MPINLLRKLNPDGTEKDRVIFDPSRPADDSLNDHTDTELRTAYINIWMANSHYRVQPHTRPNRSV